MGAEFIGWLRPRPGVSALLTGRRRALARASVRCGDSPFTVAGLELENSHYSLGTGDSTVGLRSSASKPSRERPRLQQPAGIGHLPA